ncbi:MAG TPA: hypothetical protein PKO06_20715, partial [Candidatus Ozemobacteraceae bacterium]|nr:hypothetical protein [Candidatus Ozemobacteraceae bacterium]
GLLNLEWLYPLAGEQGKRRKYLLIGFLIVIASVIGLHTIFSFSTRVFHATSGVGGPPGLWKFLGE